jgi:Fe2+ transport system protein FeoA
MRSYRQRYMRSCSEDHDRHEKIYLHLHRAGTNGDRKVSRMKLCLTELKNGESGVVTSVESGHRGRHGDHSRAGRGWGFRKRLEDMGLTPGTRLTVVKSAPFRGPLEVLVRGSRLAIGKGMAERIFVEVDR